MRSRNGPMAATRLAIGSVTCSDNGDATSPRNASGTCTCCWSAHVAVCLNQRHLNSRQRSLGLVGVANDALLHVRGATWDISEPRGKQSAAAGFSRGDRQMSLRQQSSDDGLQAKTVDAVD